MQIIQIPDGEILYRYVKPAAFPDGQEEIPGGIFSDPELSCDWKKYNSRPQESPQVKIGKTVIIAINICEEIRNPSNPKNSGKKEVDWHQEIIYDPVKTNEITGEEENLAHSLISGKKKKAVTDAIVKNAIILKPTE